MRKLTLKSTLLGTASAILLAGAAEPALAQDSGLADAAEDGSASDQYGDIIVTARKREESLQDVPVVVSALSREQLESLGVANVKDLVSLVPGLLTFEADDISPAPIISLRGVSTGSTNVFGDQAVAINLDGVQIENAIAMRLGSIDVQQVEVLKGPQALFFGKNNTGGVIAMKTADPASETLVRVRAGYEYNAQEKFGELIVSTPISETLGIRAVAYLNGMDGWLENNSLTEVSNREAPNQTEFIGRLTLKWEPNDVFSARAKVTYGHKEGDYRSLSQVYFCPSLNSVPTGDCEGDEFIDITEPFTDPRDPFFNSTIWVASGEMNYSITDDIDITSVTSYHQFEQEYLASTAPSTYLQLLGFPPSTEFVRDVDDYVRGVAQELRITTNFAAPYNLMVGAFFDDRRLRNVADGVLAFPVIGTNTEVNTKSFSIFGQGIVDISDQLELSAGARWSTETKSYDGIITEPFAGFPAGSPVVPVDDEFTNKNVSPEFTVTYRPSDNLTAYASYKQGFKSGSFDASTTRARNAAVSPMTIDLQFEPEKAQGQEIGIKSTLFDRALRLNAAAYNYKYTNLQLTTYNPETLETGILNAGASRVKGFEVDVSWRPDGVDGLTLNGAFNYNRARYLDFVTDCNQSQFFRGAAGCTIDTDGNGSLEAQQLRGEPLNQAPEVTFTTGFNFDRDFSSSSNLAWRFGMQTSYSSSYQTDAKNDPVGIQDSFFLLHANASLYSHDGWSIDIIGRNLTDKRYFLQSASLPFTGLLNGGQGDNQLATFARSRSIMVQFKVNLTDLFGG